MNEIEILQELIRIPSLSGQEVQIQKWIVRYLQNLDMNPVIINGNVTAKIAGTCPDKALILNAHVDTVDVGNINDWKYGPFEGKIVGSRVYGRGASDNKASVAVLMDLVSLLKKKQPVVDVWFTWTKNEETTGEGARDVVEWFVANEKSRYQQVAAVIGEPTRAREIYSCHKGNIFAEITVKGDSGHASRPDLVKVEAIEEMMIIKKLIKKDFGGNMTYIHAGDNTQPNRFPERCTAVFDIRTEISNHQKALQRLGKLKECRYIYSPMPPGYTSREEKIVRVAEEVSGKVAGEFPSSADLCSFTAAGIPGIIFGPGEPGVMHKANEYCEKDQLIEAKKYYLELIEKFGIME